MRKSTVGAFVILACLIAVTTLSYSNPALARSGPTAEPVEFTSLDSTRDTWNFELAWISASGSDTDGDDLVDVVSATFRLTNTSGYCQEYVLLKACGELERYIADLGCPSTVPNCPDPAGDCWLDAYHTLYPQCSHIWLMCVNEDDAVGPDQAVTLTGHGGLPYPYLFYQQHFEPYESVDFQITFRGSLNLVHTAFATEVALAFSDKDCDGVIDEIDNCPDDYNPFQIDDDADWVGQVCDCDDLDFTVSPKWLEHYTWGVCEDGKDNDCDGLTDQEDDGCILTQLEITDATYVEGGLNMGFAMSTPMPVLWVTALIVTVPSIQVAPLWTSPLPVIPYLTEEWFWFPMIPTGPMGLLTYFYATEIGFTAFDFAWVEFWGPGG